MQPRTSRIIGVGALLLIAATFVCVAMASRDAPAPSGPPAYSDYPTDLSGWIDKAGDYSTELHEEVNTISVMEPLRVESWDAMLLSAASICYVSQRHDGPEYALEANTSSDPSYRAAYNLWVIVVIQHMCPVYA